MENSSTTLANAYQNALTDLPQHWIDKSRCHEAEFSKLSGLFLPGDSPEYHSAPKKILLVGRETRNWNVLTSNEKFEGLENYIFKAMSKQQKHLTKFINCPKDRGESFFNLLCDLAKDHGARGIAWANLFCFAWNANSPMKWKHFEEMLIFSEKLLKIQLDILQPDIVIFANGASSAKYRRTYFPHKGEFQVCSELGTFPEVQINQLWRFKLYGKIQCFRIQHPSSISNPSREARRFLLEHLKTI